MNKAIIYCLLLLVYLGLSKSLSPSEFGISYISNNPSLSKLVPGSPVSVVLTDIHSTGFIIKTYYHKYKIIYGFQSYEELIVRTSRKFTEKNKRYLGMSVFRRFNNGNDEDYTPLPPGSIFIGDKNFGSWVSHSSGEKVWQFFRVYRQIPKYLGWNDFLPTLKVHSKIKLFQEQNKPFFGPNDEFGFEGSISREAFPHYYERLKTNTTDMKTILRQYLKENFIK